MFNHTMNTEINKTKWKLFDSYFKPNIYFINSETIMKSGCYAILSVYYKIVYI